MSYVPLGQLLTITPCSLLQKQCDAKQGVIANLQNEKRVLREQARELRLIRNAVSERQGNALAVRAQQAEIEIERLQAEEFACYARLRALCSPPPPQPAPSLPLPTPSASKDPSRAQATAATAAKKARLSQAKAAEALKKLRTIETKRPSPPGPAPAPVQPSPAGWSAGVYIPPRAVATGWSTGAVLALGVVALAAAVSLVVYTR